MEISRFLGVFATGMALNSVEHSPEKFDFCVGPYDVACKAFVKDGTWNCRWREYSM